jgi:hypothetical protein
MENNLEKKKQELLSREIELKELYGNTKIMISIIKDDIEVENKTVGLDLYNTMKELHDVNLVDEIISSVFNK